MARFGFEDELGEIAHAARIEHAVEMIELVLHDARMKTTRSPRDSLSVRIHALIAHVGRPFDKTAQARHRKASLPAAFFILVQDLQFGIDENRERRGMVEALGFVQARIAARLGRLEDDEPKRHMHLGCGEARAIGIDHGLYHVGDQPADFGRGGVCHRFRAGGQHRMAHSRDFQDSHGQNMGWRLGSVKAAPWHGFRQDGQAKTLLLSSRPSTEAPKGQPLQIIVRDNNIDQALKALKKKMQREGIFREMKLRGHYEKPSEKRARERAEAIRRYRKLQRKRMQREGLLPK
jgi:small subunit ribosomal protein S21